MATIFPPDLYATFERRVLAMRPDSRRQWGRMSPHEAICHLADAFRMALSEKPVAPVRARFRRVVRFVALRVPMPWPRGLPTMPEVEQGRGGTPPAEFERDRQELMALMARFHAAGPADLAPAHPLFGPMRPSDWEIWADRHLDHHLRQFGV
jgi:hypothetical protein